MRILHTSDWHLGRKLATHDVHDFQEAALGHIVDAAIEQRTTAVLVSGDVFDGPVPPVDSLKLLNRILTRLRDAGIITIVIAGNHDQAERLAANANLMHDAVHIVGSTRSLTQPVELADEHGPVLVYPVTFLWPDAERHNLAAPGEEPLDRSHEAVTRVALQRIREDRVRREAAHGEPIRTVVMTHAFVTAGGAEPTDDERAKIACESERDLSIGGVQTVPAALFDGFTYVALGHLHRSQQVSMPQGSATVTRYSGSLLRYSLSETLHEKSFAVVTLGDPGTPAEVERLPIPQGRGMARLRDTLENLLSDRYAAHFDDFVELITTDRERPDHLFARLSSKYAAIIAHYHIPDGRDPELLGRRATDRDRHRQPIDILKDFVGKVTGLGATAAEADVLSSALEAVETGSGQ